MDTEQTEQTTEEVDGTQTQEETTEELSGLQQFMSENGIENEDELLNTFKQLEQDKVRLQREAANFQSETQEKEETPKIPDDSEEFFKDFVKKPKEVLNNFFNEQNKVRDQFLSSIETNQAILNLKLQKDYDEKLESQVYSAINDNANRWFQVDGKSVQMKDLRPIDKINASLQIVRESQKGKELKQNTKSTPTKVAAPKKSTTSLDNKSDTAMTSKEFQKKYGLSRVSE